jgi:hypothetical protein
MLGLVVGGLVAAVVTVAVAPAGAGPVVVEAPRATAPVIAPATPSPAATRSAQAAPRTSTAAPRPAATTKRSRTAKPTPTTSCADRARRAGRFDPSCSDYQGYLDPGTVAGREPTSGEIQAQYACEQGLIPRSQCR